MKKPLNVGKKRKIIIAIVGVLVVAGIITAKVMLSGPAVAVTEVAAVKQDITKYYSFSGNIESSDVQNVVSTTNEPVKKFYVKEGDQVQVGDLLYEVDSNTIQSTLTAASASLSNAKTTYAADKLDYERKKEIYALGGIALEEFENAKDALSSMQNQVAVAQASYAQAQKQWDDTKCYSEVSGEVTKIYVDVNDAITQNTSIMDIVNYNNLEISIKVDEYDLSAIHEGIDAEVYLGAIGKTVTGTISEIARGASVENGVSYFETTVVLPKDTSLRVGLSAEVKVVTQSAKNAVTVPVKAIKYEVSNTYVQNYNDKGTLEKIPVTLGISNGNYIEVKKGLNAGDTIVFIDSTAASETPTLGGGLGSGRLGGLNNSQPAENGSQNGSGVESGAGQ